MLGGNETWIRIITKKNINKIYKFLEAKSLEAKDKGKYQPSFTYSQISRSIGMDRRSVMFACNKLAFKNNPYVKIRTTTFRSKKGVQCGERVKLIRFTKKKSAKTTNAETKK